MKKLILASGNKGKIREIKELLKDKYEVVAMSEIGFMDDIEETGNTFFENALIKAKTVSKFCGEEVLADDSGLCVDFLNGAPGIFSARYGGEHGNDKKNRLKLLENMKDAKNRNAKFVCETVIYKPSGEIIHGHGETCGKIAYEEIGDNGFGYDNIFISDDLNKSFGICTEEEKNSVSHRSRSLNDLLKHL